MAVAGAAITPVQAMAQKTPANILADLAKEVIGDSILCDP
jgi:hypothetical protein